MGRFLAIGLPYEIFVAPERTYNRIVSLEDVREELERSQRYDMNLFEGEEKGESRHVFTLKHEVLKEGLLPFLESFYPTIYHKPKDDGRGYSHALETLRTTPFEQWLDFAREISNYAFQMDTNAESLYLEIQKSVGPIVRLQFHCLLLYLGYGKVITEGINDFANFFKFCMHETFSEHPIVKAVKIYITG
ncbi:MAG: hypothetical protein FWH27_12190 [Planctomycetaceae bacterium]|nr:hypothetical protein [Planctomycetaceae bacterium]